MTGLALSLSFFGDDDLVNVSLRSPCERSSVPLVEPFWAESNAFGVWVTSIAVRLGSLLPRLDEVAFSLEPAALGAGVAVVEDRLEPLSMMDDDLRDSNDPACMEPVEPRRAASSGEMVLIALKGILTDGLTEPPDNGLGVGSTLKPCVIGPRFMFLGFLFFCRSSCIFFSQMSLLMSISSTANRIAGNISATASNSGLANIFMKPIWDSPSLIMSSRTGGPPNRHEGISSSCSIKP